MGYTPVPAFFAGETIDEVFLNTYWRDNMAAGVPDVFSAKGQLVVGLGVDDAAVLNAGSTDGQVLVTAAAETTGLKWVKGGMFLIEATELLADAGNFEFLNIPDDFSHLVLKYYVRTTGATSLDDLALVVNGDTGANYDYERSVIYVNTIGFGTFVNAANFAWGGFGAGNNAVADSFAEGEISIPRYAARVGHLTMKAFGSVLTSIAASGNQSFLGASRWRSTAPVTSLSLDPQFASSNLKTGSHFALYGIL